MKMLEMLKYRVETWHVKLLYLEETERGSVGKYNRLSIRIESAQVSTALGNYQHVTKFICLQGEW